jgi:predicted transcriptional regulator
MALAPNSGPATKLIIKVPADTLHRLDSLAEEAGVTRSVVIRRALDLLDPAEFAQTVASRLLLLTGEADE